MRKEIKMPIGQRDTNTEHFQEEIQSTIKTENTLSQSAFLNPSEFLHILKADVSKSNGAGDFGGSVTKNDLVLYSLNTPEDPQGESVAKMAANKLTS